MLKDGEKGVILQRDKQTYAIAPHVPCGVITPDLLRKIADTAEKYNIPVLKITSAARIAMVGIQEENVDSIWEDLGMSPGHAVGLCIRSIKCCPGSQFCRLAKQDSLTMGMKLDEIYHGLELPSKTKMGVSGCQNQCAETWIKDIGLVGKKNGWTLMVGGAGASTPRIAQILLEDLSSDEAIARIQKVIAFYQENGKKLERIGKMIDRIGFETLKAAVL